MHNTWLRLLNYCNDWFLNMINIRNLSKLTFISLFFSMLVVSYTIAESKIIYLVNTGWHVGIVVPVDATLKRNLPETKHFSDSNFLEIGWGDARFYKSKNSGGWLGSAGLLHGGHRYWYFCIHLYELDYVLKRYRFFAQRYRFSIKAS